MKENEKLKNELVLSKGKESVSMQESGTKRTELVKPENKMSVESNATRISVLDPPFVTMKEESLSSINLLNSLGNDLLQGLRSLVPKEDSVKQMSEYSAKSVTEMANSICNVVKTKTDVIKSLHKIHKKENK